ncbi:type IV pilin protein [Haliangium ochraceum]|uniref:Fimbiral protein PilA n=1 Tax=Haliangium ochraceum (strain DSM 14365 / JCM 11303 / SMP-2) TaxID=502025 RepID=D0LKT3_HALO1|nr:prepilin-type N-terminal cleavage/methylation domain-containing protein [Haliangium ochraceum]ACY16653.1 fimbiral protein PilA [Haliangium ochraceum DSM 14365]
MLSKLQSRQKGFTLIELMIVVAIIGILAAVAIPAFMRYMNKAKSSEAEQMVKKVHDGAISYYHNPPQTSFGTPAKGFPITQALTPTAACCQPGVQEKCPADAAEAAEWAASNTWKSLNFSMDSPHYYQYEFLDNDPAGELTGSPLFVAGAEGDLDCDGVTGRFEMGAEVTADGDLKSSSAIRRTNENE